MVKKIDEIDLVFGVLVLAGLYYLGLGIYMMLDWYKIIGG